MRQRTILALAMLLSSCLFSENYSCLNGQINSVQASSEDTKAIEAILHSNPSDPSSKMSALPTSLAQ